VVAGQDAVLSTLGVPYSRKPITVYSQGTVNIIQAMKHHGLRRLVCVSSGATNPHDDPQESFIFRKIIKPIVGRTLYADMARMEALVRESDRDWTIIRPARLFDTPTVTHYQVAQAYVVPGARNTSRADLADFMLHFIEEIWVSLSEFKKCVADWTICPMLSSFQLKANKGRFCPRFAIYWFQS